MNQKNENKTERKEEQPNTIDTLTKEQATESNAIEIPKVELPKGGGALKGIDEKFEVNAANGTASFSIPLPIAPGRNGFSPSLALSYSSGGGNSAFGLGWSVSYPMIQRKTDKKLPTYQQEDTFMFSGAEDLVPLLERDAGEWKKKSINNENYTILRYRPRVEGGFARIERIFRKSDKQTYWKVTTRENITTFFGLTPESRIADPQDDQKIYTWLPAFSYDDKGNWIKYEYKAENLENVANELHERNRYNGIASFTNRYLKRVKYGNRVAWYADEEQPYNPTLPTDDAVYFFELVMDYGEHQDPETPEEIPTYNEKNRWLSRPDAFSSYRAGFEVRTYRRCYNILMFHHFEEERQFVGTSEEEDFGKEYLVSALALKYAPSSINQSGQTEVSYLASVTQEGYIRKENDYFVKSLPPMEFDYQPLDWNTKVRVVDQESIANAPVGLTNNYQWVDLYGEGINGILTEQAEAWYYKSNLGDTDEDQQVKFPPAQKVINKPSFIGITSGTLSLQDLEANGEKQVVVNSPGVQGYFTLTEDNTYQAFQPFETVSSIDIQDPHVRLLDLDGAGQPEIVLTEEHVFTWYTSNGTKGYEAAKQSSKPFNEEQGPAVVFADTDQQESIFLADMTGDGLTDIVRVRNGEICYWANKGYGKFSAKVSMNNTPLFDLPDQFNPRYLQLVDVSGTGATDLIYLGKNKFKAYINLSGNAWSEAQEIEPFFPIDGNTKISVVDLLGTGTSCIVWSSDLPAESQAPMRYIDLMDSKKPHILTKYVNNFGKETTLTYKSSTYYYLKDKQAGKPWATKLPFPVQVVAKTVVEDKITDVRFSAEYAYHHGYYDHAEREFRGFGMVEQKDTEEYENWQSNNAGNRLERSYDLYQPSTLTKTWFHTGAFIDKERLLSYFEKEYWYQAYQKAFPDPTILTIEQAYQLPETQIVTNPTIANNFDINQLSAEEYREALRACKGMVLRQEIFALDAEKRSQEEQQQKGYADDPDFLAFKTQAQQTELKPYTVATHNCHIQLLQARGDNPHASFMVTESEALTLHYERDERDLRIAHSLNTQIDKLGNILASAAVVYPRKNTDALNTSISEAQALLYQRGGEKTTYLQHLQQLQQAQAKTHIIYTQNEFTNDVLQDNSYRLRLPTEVKTFEVTGLAPSATLYQLEDFQDVLGNNTEEIAYTATPNETDVQRRLIEHVRTLYYNEALTDTLPLGQLPTHGISYESYQLAYTSNLLNELFTGKIVDTDNLMNNEGKFVQSEGDNNWWIRSGLPEFVDATNGEDITTVRARFFSPIRYRSPFDAVTSVTYYKDYYLLLQASEDALQNRMEVERFNFRVLAPTRMKDPNDNLAEVLLDELGLVKATATLGKGNEADNLDDLTEYTPQAERDTIENYFTLADSDDLQLAAKNLLQKASARFVYNFHRYQTSVQLRAEQRANNPNVP
ncbi:MAG: SpvB/TcaC N-terminal domain-containing protein [Thermonemataceae bacterium]